jgi:hypothetical protein
MIFLLLEQFHVMFLFNAFVIFDYLFFIDISFFNISIIVIILIALYLC